MALTLSTARDVVEVLLSDTANLIFSTDMLDQCLRAALSDLSRAYDESLTLNGLDGAAINTFDALDEQLILQGAVAYTLAARTAARHEQASPEGLPASLAAFSEVCMTLFQNQLLWVQKRVAQKADLARLTALQSASDPPYAAWQWAEGTDFS